MLVTNDNFKEAWDSCWNALYRERELTVDLETTGLRPYHGDRLCGIAILAGNDNWYFPFRHAEGFNLPYSMIKPVGSLLIEPSTTYLGYNYKFDMQFLYAEGIPLPTKIQDPMLAANLMNENEPTMQLKALGDKYIHSLSSQADKELQALLAERGLAKGDIWKLPSHLVEPYACQDVYLTRQLRDFYKHQLENWKIYDLWLETCAYEIALTRMEIDGMLIDRSMTRDYLLEAETEMERTRDELRRLADNPKLNPASSPQMSQLLEMPSTAREHLERAYPASSGDKREIMRLVREHRGWARAAGVYYGPYLEYADEKGLIHASINMVKDQSTQSGTVTSRLSVNKPNLQQIPRHGDDDEIKQLTQYGVKEVFYAQDGYKFAVGDYSQAELRLLCHYTNDTAMIEAFLNDRDLHGETAKSIGIDRDKAKRTNYGSVYGIGGRKLAVELNIPQKEAALLLRKYHGLYPGIRAVYNAVQAQAEKKRYIRLWSGRLRHYNVPEAYTHKAMSNLIQGGVAEIMRVAITRLYEDFKDTPVEFGMSVHDSIIWRIPDRMVDEVLAHAQEVMEDFKFRVPPKVDMMVGPSWGKVEKWSRTASTVSIPPSFARI